MCRCTKANRIKIIEYWKFGQWYLPCAVPDVVVLNYDASPFVPQCEFVNIGSPRSVIAAPVLSIVTISLERALYLYINQPSCDEQRLFVPMYGEVTAEILGEVVWEAISEVLSCAISCASCSNDAQSSAPGVASP